MNILVITPLYYIAGRPDLIHDTNAVHYLIKYWSAENCVKVFNVYTHSYRAVKRYLSKKMRQYYKTGYDFETDGIRVHLAEVQKFPRQRGRCRSFQIRHVMRQFDLMMQDEEFVPDLILVHFPSYAVDYIDLIKKYFPKEIKTIGVLHGTDILELKSRRVKADMLRKQYDALFARSIAIREKGKKFKLDQLREEIIQSGVPFSDMDHFRSPVADESCFRIVYVGKLIKRKHPELVISVIRNHPSIELDVIGTGPEEMRLHKLVKKYGISKQVHFIGMIPREDVLRKMAEAHMFCLPSVNETLGLTYLEAMSVGCVPIGTMGEGIDGIIIHKENGYLVNRDCMQEDLEKYIMDYRSKSVAERQIISDKAYETARFLKEESCSVKYLNILKKTMAEC